MSKRYSRFLVLLVYNIEVYERGHIKVSSLFFKNLKLYEIKTARKRIISNISAIVCFNIFKFMCIFGENFKVLAQLFSFGVLQNS